MLFLANQIPVISVIAVIGSIYYFKYYLLSFTYESVIDFSILLYFS